MQNAPSLTQVKNANGMHVDEVTKKKIQEHLNNEDDIITEQDIANINTGVGNESENLAMEDLQDEDDTIDEKQTKEDEEEVQEKKVNDNDSPAIETPWNIL